MQAPRLALQEFVVLRAVVAGDVGVFLHAAQDLVGEQGRDIDREKQQLQARELFGVAEVPRVEDLLQRRHGRFEVGFERRDARLQLGGLGFAFGVAPILVLARRGVLRRLDRAEERRDQVVLKGVILVGDERDQMQMPINGAAASQIPNVGLNDGLGVDPHALLIPAQSADQGIKPRVQLREFVVVGQPGLDFLRPDRLGMALQRGEAIPSITAFVVRLLEQCVQLGLQLLGKPLLDQSRLPYPEPGNRREDRFLQPMVGWQNHLFGRQLLDGGVENRLGRIVRGHVPVDRFDKARVLAVVHRSKPGQVLDDLAMALAASRRVRRGAEQGGVMAEPRRHVGNIAGMKVFRFKAPASVAKIPGVQPEADLMDRIAQLFGFLLEGAGQIKDRLSLRGVQNGRRAERMLFDGGEDLHSRHGGVSFLETAPFAKRSF